LQEQFPVPGSRFPVPCPKLRAMKAIVIPAPGGPEVLELLQVPDPVAGPDDLLVRVRAAGLNRADLQQRLGSYPQPGVKPEFEIPGLEFAGEVVSMGARVQGFAVGNRVMGLLPGGGYAEMVTTHNRLAVKVPQSLSWQEAGGTPEVYITAHDALLQCGLVAGESALIHAAGSGVGVAAIQIAKAMGASFVAGTAGSVEKLAKAAALGMDLGVNYRTQDFADEVLKATGGRGVDVVLDVIGAEYWERNMRALAPKGRMILVGLMGGGATQANIGMLLAKRLQVRGTTLRARPIEEKGAATRAFEKSVLPHLASGRVKVVVDRTFPLAEAAAAHAYLASNANFGKVVLEV
jgi:NADPH:quinone reductase